MSLFESIKNMFFGATAKEIEAAQLRARIDVLVAKHGGMHAMEPSLPLMSAHYKLDTLLSKHMGASNADNIEAMTYPNRAAFGQENYDYFNAKPNRNINGKDHSNIAPFAFGTGVLNGTEPGNLFDSGPFNVFDMDSMSGPEGALLYDDLEAVGTFIDTNHI